MLRGKCCLSVLSWDISAYSALNWKALAFFCCHLTLKTHSSLLHTPVLCISEAVHQAGLSITLMICSSHDRLLSPFQPSVFPKLHLILYSSLKSHDLAVGLHRSWNAWDINGKIPCKHTVLKPSFLYWRQILNEFGWKYLVVLPRTNQMLWWQLYISPYFGKTKFSDHTVSSLF